VPEKLRAEVEEELSGDNWWAKKKKNQKSIKNTRKEIKKKNSYAKFTYSLMKEY
jgi:hypothetical protein